jgi:hypothetical protein
LTNTKKYAIVFFVILKEEYMNITVMLAEEITDEDALFLKEKISASRTLNPVSICLIVTPVKNWSIDARAKLIREEMEKGNLVVTTIIAGEAIRYWKRLGCVELVLQNDYYMFSKKNNARRLVLVSKGNDVVLWPKAEKQRLVPTLRLPYRDD